MGDDKVISKITAIIDGLRPNFQMDGGDIEFIRFEDGIVYVRVHGVCKQCPHFGGTLKGSVEEALRNDISEVHEVVAVD